MNLWYQVINNGSYVQNECILIRAHLRGLGVPIFQAKNVPCITVSNYQVHICFLVEIFNDEVAILQLGAV